MTIPLWMCMALQPPKESKRLMKKKDCENCNDDIWACCECLEEQLDAALEEVERLEKRPTEEEWNHLVDCDSKKAEHIMELCDENLKLLKKYEPEKVITFEEAYKRIQQEIK